MVSGSLSARDAPASQAYVFWHWREPSAPVPEYELALTAFHAELNRVGASGFLRSATYRIPGLPWLDADEGYEDWYLLQGSAALDPLNDVAISARMAASHDRAARHAEGGAGGLYQLLRGRADLDSAALATWLSKPKEAGYAEFQAALDRLDPAPLAVWRRRLTLGPAPEFCLWSQGRLTTGFPALEVDRYRL